MNSMLLHTWFPNVSLYAALMNQISLAYRSKARPDQDRQNKAGLVLIYSLNTQEDAGFKFRVTMHFEGTSLQTEIDWHGVVKIF